MFLLRPHATAHVIIRNGIIALSLLLRFCDLASAEPSRRLNEKEVIRYIASEAFNTSWTDRRCHNRSTYRVYLIDNFEQRVDLVPEVLTSHGEMLLRLLQADREDIEVRVLNTSLSRGLAQVIHDLREGACVDAVVSSTPGSNYTYDQISSLLGYRVNIAAENILYHRSALGTLLRNIAHRGFPSVEWLQTIDVNAAKLRNDARKFVFIEALGRFSVPVVLPNGNRDVRHRGRIKAVNPYVWLNAPDKGLVFEFAPVCWARGTIGGTSVIPPNKLRELLPPKSVPVSHAAGEKRQPGIDG